MGSRAKPGGGAPDLVAIQSVLAQVEARSEQVRVQAQEVRELLAEVRGATKDLNQAVRESREAFKGLAEEMMKPVIEEKIEAMQESMAQLVVTAGASIRARFDALYSLLMTGSASGRPDPKALDVEKAVRDKAAENAARARVGGPPAYELFVDGHGRITVHNYPEDGDGEGDGTGQARDDDA